MRIWSVFATKLRRGDLTARRLQRETFRRRKACGVSRDSRRPPSRRPPPRRAVNGLCARFQAASQRGSYRIHISLNPISHGAPASARSRARAGRAA